MSTFQRAKQPLQEVTGNFCSYSTQHYLVLVDCYPNWPDIIPMGHDATAPHLIKVVR